MNKILREKIQEALSSVLPITLIVLVLSMTITPMPVGTLVLFLAGAVLLIVGMAFFSLGTDVSMTPMGEGIGAQLPKTKNLAVVIAITLLIGILITIAEPDLQVLAGQVPSIPNSMLIWTVAVGVGLFFVLALLRTIFKIRLSLCSFYSILQFSAFPPLCRTNLYRLHSIRAVLRPADHGSVHHGARRWSRFDTRRQRRTG